MWRVLDGWSIKVHAYWGAFRRLYASQRLERHPDRSPMVLAGPPEPARGDGGDTGRPTCPERTECSTVPFDSMPFDAGPPDGRPGRPGLPGRPERSADGVPPDPVCAWADDADAARLRGFARAVLSGHTAGHVMGSGVRLCRCGAVLEACRYRALARTHLAPTQPRQDPSVGAPARAANPTSLRSLGAGRPVRCRRRPRGDR